MFKTTKVGDIFINMLVVVIAGGFVYIATDFEILEALSLAFALHLIIGVST